jgi:insertion element IS1 protein InsB
MNCPSCGLNNIVKNGFNKSGNQNYLCNDCKRQFVQNPQKQPISDEKKQLIDDLLLEKVPLAGIVRVAKVSKRWLQNYVNEKYNSIDKNVTVKKKEKDV